MSSLLGIRQAKSYGRRYDWSDLAQLYLGDGLSSAKIARIKGCSGGAVCHALTRHHIPRRRPWFDDPGRCTVCGICVGPDYNESTPYPVGDKTLCSCCYAKLEKQGFIQLADFRRLLPDGRLVGGSQPLTAKAASLSLPDPAGER